MARKYIVPTIGIEKKIEMPFLYFNPLQIKDGGAIYTPKKDIIQSIRQAVDGDAVQLEYLLAEMTTA